MKRIILTGALALAAGVTCLSAQQAAQPAGQPAQAKGPQAKSQGELQAVQALFTAAQNQANPDAVIKAAEDLTTKYADSDFKEYALQFEATAYQQKGDVEKAQIYGEKVLQINPKSFQTMLMLGEILATHTRENDLDRAEKMAQADKYLNGAITTLQTAPKPNPNLPDEQWEQAKKQIMAQAHNDLGLMALTSKKYDAAITEFKTAVDMDPQAAYSVRLASAYQDSGKHQEAIDICKKLLEDPQLHPQIKAVAQQIQKAAESGKK